MSDTPEPPPLRTHEQPPPGAASLSLPPNGHNQEAPYVPNDDERLMGMLIHLLNLLTGFIGPLILWLIKKDESRFIDHHGKEALNFAISLLIYSTCLVALFIVVGVLTLGIGFLVLMPLFFAFGVAVWIFEILACVQAYQGSWYHFPLTIRFIR